jgi:prevent-host-death family protein
VKAIAAARFKNSCLKTIDQVARNRTTVTITKRGRPVARLVPVTRPGPRRSLIGSILWEKGDPPAPARRGMPIVLDTQAWLWWVGGDRRPLTTVTRPIRSSSPRPGTVERPS